MTLWGGRFSQELDGHAWKMNSSLAFDRRLADQDCRGSIAWANSLYGAGILTLDELAAIQKGLRSIQAEFSEGSFVFAESDEDIHTAVERRLGELIGAAAGKLHTGRSRNDQVATDFRLWMLDLLPELVAVIKGLQSSLIQLSERNQRILMPGYTHLQRAQPITLAHWLMSHFWPLQRDRERLTDLQKRVAILPLGSGALAGTAFPIDRAALAEELRFEYPSWNSLDAVSDRDFAAEFLFVAAMIGVHISKLAEQMVIFTSAEFGFFTLSDAFSTGSSLMPQKKNPDLFELARGKAGTLIGLLTGMLATLKGLPSTYDKDLQEDKAAIFQAADILLTVMPVLAQALETMEIHPDRMRAAIDSNILATDLADYLVRKGVPFREAHRWVGKAIHLAGEKGVPLDELTSEDWSGLGPFDEDVVKVFDVVESVNRHDSIGGTSFRAVEEQIQRAKQLVLST